MSPPAQRLEVDERAVFLKFELFAKRLGKLCDMFTSIHQISGLEQHTHITGGKRQGRWLQLPAQRNSRMTIQGL